ncbi:MAG: hypothetical protein AB7F91_05305 [Parvularculaceae bacterium]
MSPVAFSLIAFILLIAAAGGAHLVELTVTGGRTGLRAGRTLRR